MAVSSATPDILYFTSTGANKIAQMSMTSFSTTAFVGSSTGSAGATDGVGTNARFNNPSGLTATSTQLLVCDSFNYKVRAVTVPAGVVTIVAGGTSAGYADGVGTNAMFGGVSGAALSPDELTLYVVDGGQPSVITNNIIRAIVLSTQTVTTVAGSSSTAGYTDGVGLSALLRTATSLAGGTGYWVGLSTDATGALYFLDLNLVVRSFAASTTGIVSSIAGYKPQSPATLATYSVGVGTNAGFDATSSPTISSTAAIVPGGVLVVDGFSVVRVVDIASGTVTLLAGRPNIAGFTDGAGTSARFSTPSGAYFDAANNRLFIADTGNAAIRLIVAASATSSVSPSQSSTPTASASASAAAAASGSVSGSVSVSVAPSGSVSVSVAASGSVSGSVSVSVAPSGSVSVSVAPSGSVSATVSATPSGSTTLTVSASPTVSATPSGSASGTVSVSVAPSGSVSATVSATPSGSTTLTVSASPTVSATASGSASGTVSVSVTPSGSVSATASATPSASASGSVTPTPSPSPTPVSPTPTPVPLSVTFTSALTYPVGSSPANPAAFANTTAALLGMRCDYANLAGLPLAGALITSGLYQSTTEATLNAAIAAANAATSCTAAASANLVRRALAAAPGAPGGGGLAGARALQTVGGVDWATFVVVLIPASAASGSSYVYAQYIKTTVASSTAASFFPLTTAAWAPAWSIAPASWASVVGSPVALNPATLTVSSSISFSPLPPSPTPSNSPLAAGTMLGLGFGIGLGLAVCLGAAAIAWFWCVHGRRTAAIYEFSAPVAPTGKEEGAA
jgi:hypothetical protein